MKNNKGFTLIESVITFAILAIAGLMLMSLTSNVINTMSESSLIKNEVDQKYQEIQIGINSTDEDYDIELIVDNDETNPIVSVVKGWTTNQKTEDNYDFQLSKLAVNSPWIDESPDQPPVDPEELLDATFVIIKDINKYVLEDGNGNIILNPSDYLAPNPQGIKIQNSLKKSFGINYSTIISNPNLTTYLTEMPTFNDFNDNVDPFTNLPYIEDTNNGLVPDYLKAIRLKYQNELANNTPISIEWLAIDNRNLENPIVYGIIMVTYSEGDIGIFIDGIPEIVKGNGQIHPYLKDKDATYAFYCDGVLLGSYPAKDDFWKKGFDSRIPPNTKKVEIIKVENTGK